MSYKRITINHSHRSKVSEAHDQIYAELDLFLSEYLGLGKETHQSAFDTKFYVEELADNFLQYDATFTKVTIDIWITDGDDVHLKVIHNGNDFDPLSDQSRCVNIKAAIDRLNISPQVITASERETLRFNIKYKLKHPGVG